MTIVVVFLGGGIGAAGRYLMQGAVYRVSGSLLPYGTMAVNVLGCLVIGFLMVALEGRFLVTPLLRLFLTVGILGGFTTFSSFSFETYSLFRDGELLYGLLNVILSVLCCLLATAAGAALAKFA